MTVTVPVPALGEGVTITYSEDSRIGEHLARALGEGSAASDVERHDGPGSNSSGIAADRLRSIVERVERLTEERKALGSDIKDIFLEARSSGFDVKVIRNVLRLRKLEPVELEHQEALLDVYLRALGMR